MKLPTKNVLARVIAFMSQCHRKEAVHKQCSRVIALNRSYHDVTEKSVSDTVFAFGQVLGIKQDQHCLEPEFQPAEGAPASPHLSRQA